MQSENFKYNVTKCVQNDEIQKFSIMRECGKALLSGKYFVQPRRSSQGSASLKIWPVPSIPRYPKFFFFIHWYQGTANTDPRFKQLTTKEKYGYLVFILFTVY